MGQQVIHDRPCCNHCFCKICHRVKYKIFNLTLWVPISQNGQARSNNSSAICRQIVWVCLIILWGWCLKGLISWWGRFSVNGQFLQIFLGFTNFCFPEYKVAFEDDESRLRDRDFNYELERWKVLENESEIKFVSYYPDAKELLTKYLYTEKTNLSNTITRIFNSTGM